MKNKIAKINTSKGFTAEAKEIIKSQNHKERGITVVCSSPGIASYLAFNLIDFCSVVSEIEDVFDVKAKMKDISLLLDIDNKSTQEYGWYRNLEKKNVYKYFKNK